MQVLTNCQALAKAMMSRGYTLVSGGTENHLILADLKPSGIDGARVESVLEMAQVMGADCYLFYDVCDGAGAGR